MISLLVIYLAGVIVSILSFFVISRHLESAIFWSILLGPAVGNAIINCITNLIQGNNQEAILSLRFLPFFLASIDQTFFSSPENASLIALGFLILAVWAYVLSHFAIKRFDVWGIVLIPPIIYIAGSLPPTQIGLPNMRAVIASVIPQLQPLIMLYDGIILLTLVSLLLLLIAYLLHTHRYTVDVPLPQKFYK